ncbi:TetR/AcrR family transcriptional regulator [Mycobacterium sp. DBP42]|nr:TetR/AcrR family transcriptional regulator [Mycobacterium sp. DBP42]
MRQKLLTVRTAPRVVVADGPGPVVQVTERNVVSGNNAVNGNILARVRGMSTGRYHHGDLRAALLAQAGQTLRVSGVDGLSLRELARAVGVSHGAPRRHFDDKAALLEALVADGFHRLHRALEDAVQPGHSVGAGLEKIATTYIRFATDNPALLELMASSRYLAEAPDALTEARDAAFAPVRTLVERGQGAGELAAGDVRRVGTLIFATVHGLATMATNRMIDPLDHDLIVDAVNSLLTGLGSVQWRADRRATEP